MAKFRNNNQLVPKLIRKMMLLPQRMVLFFKIRAETRIKRSTCPGACSRYSLSQLQLLIGKSDARSAVRGQPFSLPKAKVPTMM